MNPIWAFSASYDQSTNMKKLILLCICSIALAAGLFAQAPTASPVASPSATTATATASASPSDLADRIHQKLEKKLRGHHGITIDTGDQNEDADLRKMRDFVGACADRDHDRDVCSSNKPYAAADHPNDG